MTNNLSIAYWKRTSASPNGIKSHLSLRSALLHCHSAGLIVAVIFSTERVARASKASGMLMLISVKETYFLFSHMVLRELC